MSLFKKNKTNYFYEQFSVVSKYSLKAIEALKKGLENFDPTKSIELKNQVHSIEHEADLKKGEIEERLAKEFITPIDREDIFMLLNNIDDLTDSIDEISYKLYIRNYLSLPEKTDLFLKEAYKSIVAVDDLISNLPSITNKKLMDPLINKVKEIEEETDYLYEESVHNLYEKDNNLAYKDIVLQEKVYSMFEYVTDKSFDITRTIGTIMYKNI